MFEIKIQFFQQSRLHSYPKLNLSQALRNTVTTERSHN